MKKLLTILAAVGLTITTASTVIACDKTSSKTKSDQFELEKTSIVMNFKTPVKILIKNFDLLDDDSKPTSFEYSEDDVLNATFNESEKAIIISPKTNIKEGNFQIKVKSKKYSVTVNVKVENVTDTEFQLSTTSVELKRKSTTIIKIDNWDNLNENGKPLKYSVSAEGYAEVVVDSNSDEIVVKTEGKSIDNLSITLESNNGFSKEIEVKINEEKIDLSNLEVVNIIAGNMVDGQIDSSIAIGADEDDYGKYIITEESIIDSINKANNLNLSNKDLNIEVKEDSNNGLGALYKISAASTEILAGENELTLNSDLDLSAYFKVTNLGEVRLFENSLNNLDKILSDSAQTMSLAGILFENVGAKNSQLEYLKKNLIDTSDILNPPGKVIMKNSEVSETTFEIKNFPNLNGIFESDQNISFTFKFVKEDRITLSEGLKDGQIIEISPEILDDKSIEGQAKIKRQIYDELNETFKTRVSFDEFNKYTKLLYDGYLVDTINEYGTGTITPLKIDVLPGSSILYGHDGAAWNGYINNQTTALGQLGTGAGKLEDYESENSFDEKYTIGMGTFSMFGAMQGNFYQGYEIIKVVDYNTTVGKLDSVNDQEINVDYDLSVEIKGENLEYKDLELTSDNSNLKYTLTKSSDNQNFKLNFSKNSNDVGLYNIKIKVKDSTENSIEFKLNILDEMKITTGDLPTIIKGEKQQIKFTISNITNQNAKIVRPVSADISKQLLTIENIQKDENSNDFTIDLTLIDNKDSEGNPITSFSIMIYLGSSDYLSEKITLQVQQ